MSLFDTDGVLILDNDRRVGKRHATFSQFCEYLAANGENDRDLLLIALLRPHWCDGATLEQAIESWRDENLGVLTT